ncbi:MAG: hypothetical protein Ctma_0214 [Catillopecten margaritatus gill symbiont]|uniref:Uncharacterized protein n=1 Tax=Catillopecten margaritatus gill symbiont TaxID=3083288 RepID=A0AAU6PER6_9GAMM
MRNDDAVPPYETLEIGTPRDYTSDVYKVYFEVGEHNNMALEVLTWFVGKDKEKTINRLEHGYEVELSIQCVPDVVGLLTEKNIAIYQVIRYAKTGDTWS